MSTVSVFCYASYDEFYVRAHWWVDPLARLSYATRLTVKRPKDLPCAANPCPAL